MIRRILHQLHRLRWAYPNTPILIIKYDLDAAYRRLHVHLDHAVLACTVVNDMAFLDIRLPFGSSSGPIQYRDVIEAIFDLTNDFLEDQSWDVAEFHANIEPRLDAP